jgi:hypothetical protein
MERFLQHVLDPSHRSIPELRMNQRMDQRTDPKGVLTWSLAFLVILSIGNH